jgi:hypothetical protein
MSTMRVGTLSNIAGTGSPVITAGELSRARFNLNGTGTIAARDSFNVSGFTDNGTGDYTATFSTAMPNADFTGVSSGAIVATITVGSQYSLAPRATTVGSYRVLFINGGAGADPDTAMCAIFGDIP